MYQDNGAGKTLEMKKAMHLDFGSKTTKPSKFQNMLNSPDLNMLKLSSPELEKMLINQNGTVGTTPTPTQFIYPKYVTDEQEAYARGFVEALAELHSSPSVSNSATVNNSSVLNGRPVASTYSTLMPMASQATAYSSACTMPTTPTQAGGMNSISRRHPPFAPSGLIAGNPMPNQHNMLSQLHVPASSAYGTVQVKSEPSTSSYTDHQVPHSPSGASSRMTDSPSAMSDSAYDHVENVNRLDSIPVDLEEQEKIKLERKRARNRIAARKCRTRKLERIGRLEEKVADLKGRNSELAQTAASLNEQVMQLKQQIMEHMKSGCHIMMPDMGPMVGMM